MVTLALFHARPAAQVRWIALLWLLFVLVLSAAVLVIGNRWTLGLRICRPAQFHCHPSEHRDDSLELSFQNQTRLSIQPARCRENVLATANDSAVYLIASR